MLNEIVLKLIQLVSRFTLVKYQNVFVHVNTLMHCKSITKGLAFH